MLDIFKERQALAEAKKLGYEVRQEFNEENLKKLHEHLLPYRQTVHDFV